MLVADPLFPDHHLSSLAKPVCLNRHTGEEKRLPSKESTGDGCGILHPTNLQDASILKMRTHEDLVFFGPGLCKHLSL